MKPMQRHRLVGGAVLVSVLALVASACTSSAPPTTTTTTTLPPTTTTTTVPPTTTTTVPLPQHPVGGEAVIAHDDEPPTLNSFLPGGDRLVLALMGQAYAAGVFDIDAETLTLVPELVTTVPTISNGGVVLNADGSMTVKYTIREEAQWDDGTPISGDDFQFTLDTILNPAHPISKTIYENITTSTSGAKTFEFTMARPTVQYESMFSEIIPKHSVEGTDFVLDWNDKRWASAGPFVFQEWERGEYITLRRNPNYWKIDAETGQQLPYLDSVTFTFEANTAEMIELFAARGIDVFSPDPAIANIEALQAIEPQGARVDVLSGPVWEHLNFQFGPGRFDRNEDSCTEYYEMRLAIAQSIDIKVLTDDILGGKVDPLLSYIDPYSPTVSQKAWSQYSFDPAAAAENYAKAVAASGRECKVVFTTNTQNDERARMSELLSDMFAESGIPYEVELEQSMVFYGDTIGIGTWDVGAWTWHGSPGMSGLVGIHDVFDPESPPPLGSNYYRWGSPDSSVIDEATARFAEVRDQINATVDFDELVTLIQEAENILADNLVIIPLYAHPVTAAVWEDEIGGFMHNPTRAGFTWNVEFWFRNDA